MSERLRKGDYDFELSESPLIGEIVAIRNEDEGWETQCLVKRLKQDGRQVRGAFRDRS